MQRSASAFAAADTNGDSAVDFEEFCNVEEAAGASREQLKELFDRFDADKSGKLDLEEFRAYLQDGQPRDVSSWQQHWRRMRSYQRGANAFGGTRKPLTTDALTPNKARRHSSSASPLPHQRSFTEHHQRSFSSRTSFSGPHGGSLQKGAFLGPHGGSLQKCADPHGADLIAHQVAKP